MATFLSSPAINLPLLSKPQLSCSSNTSQPKQNQPQSPQLSSSSSSSSLSHTPQPQPKPRPLAAADSTDWIASSLTRRFGLGAGLAWVGFLAFGVVSEQVKTRFEVSQQEANAKNVEKEEVVVLPNSIRYYEMRAGGGATPKQGDLVVIDLKGKVVGNNNNNNNGGEEYFVNTFERGKRPLALVMGSRSYTKGMCEGVEYVLRSMHAGGKRRVIVPPELGLGDEGVDLGAGVRLPPAATLEFVVQVDRVSIAPA